MGIAAAIGAIAAGIGAGTTITATGITLGFSFIAAASSFALGALQSALAPKPKAPPLANLTGGFSARAEGITQNIRQPVSIRRTLYGEARIGGALTFIETTQSDKYLHMVVTLVDHEVEEIGEIWFDDVSIPPDHLDGSGNVTSGTFANKARIKKHLGTAAQTADSDLVSETSATTNFRGRGVAYLYVRLEYDSDIYPSKIPVISAFVKGKKVYDVRDTTTRYSPNVALISNDYLVESLDSLSPGVGVTQTDVDTSNLTAAANVCEEMVTTTDLDDSINSADSATDIITLTGVNDRLQYQTGDKVNLIGGSLPGGLAISTDYYVIPYQRKGTVRIKLASSLANAIAGTAVSISSTGTGTIRKIAEPRYFGGGVLETSRTPEENLKDILSAMGGSAIYIGGSWVIRAAAYQTPVFEFDESHMISKLIIRPKVSRRDRFNLIKGVYVSPLNDGQPSDYPSITNSTYSTNDGRTIPIDYDLPMTQRPHTAQRLAKIKLEKHRQEIFFECSFNLHAMQVQPGDVVYITNTRMGWSQKEFEVITWKLDTKEVNKVPLFYVKMALQETASAVYDWNNGEETSVDPAPNTNLPNPLVVNPPTGLAVTPREIRTAAGDLTYEFDISWTAPSDIFVVNGGKYEVQFKKSTEATFKTSYDAKDTDELITVKQVDPGVNYDTRIRAVNQLGVRSAWQSLFGFSVTSPSGATIKIDEGLITGSVVESIDDGLITDGDIVENDEGTIT